ncbi:MAG: DUF1641 domain-containing protein [Deltaproteobacteria bacterium]|nr:DUF1641 domain-containing protein [Deltaproteobacteria bacterium]
MSPEEQLLERLARIEAKLDGLDRLEKQMQVFAGTWENFHDLSRDVSLLMEPAVQHLTDELVEVETGFQLEDVLTLLRNLLPRLRYISYSLEQLENLIDWWHDMEPVLKIAVPHFIDYLDSLEQKGIFRINRAMIDMYAKIAEHYTPEDIAAIGDGFVRMHGIIKKFSEPEFIRFVEKFMDIPTQMKLEEAKPTGPMGLMFRLMDAECRQGLGVALEMTKALGKLKNGDGQPSGTEKEK